MHVHVCNKLLIFNKCDFNVTIENATPTLTINNRTI